VLENFTLESFAPRIGERFRISLDDDVLEVELVEAVPLGEPPAQAGRSPFSIIFLGPGEDVLPQRIYRFEHDELGSLDLFVVPIARDDEGVRYEAVFA
jgi:Domain of unknown function (DUF6916)